MAAAQSWNPFAGLIDALCCTPAAKGPKDFKSLERLEADVDAGYSINPPKTRNVANQGLPMEEAPTASSSEMVDPIALRNEVMKANPGHINVVLPPRATPSTSAAAPNASAAAPKGTAAPGSLAVLAQATGARPLAPAATQPSAKDDEYSVYEYEYAYDDNNEPAKPTSSAPPGVTKKPIAKPPAGAADDNSKEQGGAPAAADDEDEYYEYEYEYVDEDKGKADDGYQLNPPPSAAAPAAAAAKKGVRLAPLKPAAGSVAFEM